MTITTPPTDTAKPTVPGKPVVVAGSVTDTAAGFTLGRVDRQRRRDGVPHLPRRRRRRHLADGVVHGDRASRRAPSTSSRSRLRRRGQPVGQEHRPQADDDCGEQRRGAQHDDPVELLDHPVPTRDATWKDPSFVVPADWKSGVPQLGFGDGDEATLLDRGGSTSSTGIITWYFRTSFDVPNLAAVNGLVASLIRDDGAAVYVNGVEVFRSNLPGGSPLLHDEGLRQPRRGGREEPDPVHHPARPRSCRGRTSSRSSSTTPVRRTATPASS